MDYITWYNLFVYAAVNKDELLQMVRFGAEMVFECVGSFI